MNPKMRLTLKAGERIFINGAVLMVNQKVTLSLLNDARFLLENYVLQVDEANTPMRQLYFVVQAMLISPQDADKTILAFHNLYDAIFHTQKDDDMRERLRAVRELVEADRTFDALRTIRTLFEPNISSPSVPKVADNRAA